MGKQLTQPGAAVVHFSKNHTHIEFSQQVPLNSKRSSTALGYILLVNSILALVIIALDIYNLVAFQNTYQNTYNIVVGDSPTVEAATKISLFYDCMMYENLKWLSIGFEGVCIALTWTNHFVLDMYKISHPVTFVCLAF